MVLLIRRKYLICILLVTVASLPSFIDMYGQGATDLYLFQLEKTPDNAYHVYNPKYLSGFNAGGYTNQPWFISPGELLVSVRKAGEKQNDIYQLSLKTKKIKRLTQTQSNEYSPRLHPDGDHISVLRQVEGDDMDQQVCVFSKKGRMFKNLVPAIRNAGYYTWINDHGLGIFVIEGESNRLMYHQLAEQKSRRVTSSIGRTLLSDKGSIVYVHKYAENDWYIKKYDPVSSIIDVIVETPEQSEDFALAADGTFFMGRNEKLYFFHPSLHTEWQEITDLSVYGIDRISRLALSPDGKQLALVSMRDNP